MKRSLSSQEKARTAWGEPAPAWVMALAEACDQDGLRKTAQNIGVSPTLVSFAIHKKREDLEYIKLRVEVLLMIATVECPILGAIDSKECLREQKIGFSTANPIRIQLYKACRSGCTHFKG